MGYCVDMDIANVFIDADKVSDCLNAINDMFTDENLSDNGSGGEYGPHITKDTPIKEKIFYSWVNTPENGKFDTLKEALDEWRYACEVYEDGSVQITYFHGEKLGDDFQLMEVIAPFVQGEVKTQSCAEIDCRGEDGCLWQWKFENGSVKERHGSVSYGD